MLVKKKIIGLIEVERDEEEQSCFDKGKKGNSA